MVARLLTLRTDSRAQAMCVSGQLNLLLNGRFSFVELFELIFSITYAVAKLALPVLMPKESEELAPLLEKLPRPSIGAA
jgi:hypothetical protein